MTRPVDQAMSAERPEKQRVRKLWLDRIRDYAGVFPDDSNPLYLTLSGAEGRDIELLVDAGLIRLTEVGSIAEEDQNKLVAVEYDINALFQLKLKFPGLRVFEQKIQSLLRGTSPLRFPEREHERYCRARVVNLDLDESLSVVPGPGRDMPVMQLVDKLCTIHSVSQIDWSLLLTLHGEITWDLDFSSEIEDFLSENFEREPAFAASAKALLGEELYSALSGNERRDHRELGADVQQKLLMVFVPKKIASLVYGTPWRVTTRRNLRYGGVLERAPMVTWIIDFAWDSAAEARPDSAYRESLRYILEGAGHISEDGILL